MRILLTLMVLAFSSLATTDDAFWSAVGGAGNFGKSKDIRMVSEEVRITLNRHSTHVRASFEFKDERNQQTVTMAFPDGIEDLKSRTPRNPLSISNFRSWVDGRAVRVRRQLLDPNSKSGSYSAVWLKTVPFGKHGKRHVVCEYNARYAQGEPFVTADYVLKTGATWKGKIGHARIIVDWKNLGQSIPNFLLNPAPLYTFGSALSEQAHLKASGDLAVGDEKAAKGRLIGRHTAVFDFSNFEPDADLEMTWPNKFPNFFVNGGLVGGITDNDDLPVIEGSPADPTIELLGMPQLLGDIHDVQKQEGAVALKTYEIRGHKLDFPDRSHLRIDGRLIALRQPLTAKAGGEFGQQSIHIRELVSAFGGKYEYDSHFRRENILIHWWGLTSADPSSGGIFDRDLPKAHKPIKAACR